MIDHPCRTATREDLPTILSFVRELAALEGRPEAVTATVSDLESLLFGQRPLAEAVIIVDPEQGTAVGYAWYYFTTSTFTGTPTLYLEDLFLAVGSRGRGQGLRAMRWLARAAMRRACARMEWSAVVGNTAAHQFYENLGATRKSGSVGFTISGAALAQLAI